MKFKEKVFKIISANNKEYLPSKVFDYSIYTIILLNLGAIVLASFAEMEHKYTSIFWKFEIFSVTIFTLEYILRIWTADLLYKNVSRFKAILKFMFSSEGLIDLFAILPFYLPYILKIDLRLLWNLRLIRLLRVLKLGRYSKSIKVVGRVLSQKKADLGVTFFITFILMVVASSLMYNLENEAQPDAFPNILSTFWWAIVTLTTVGYGDVYPITPWGKVIGGIIALLGIGIVALPTGIISSAFMEEVEKSNEKKKEKKRHQVACKYCPNCGTNISAYEENLELAEDTKGDA
ncbi:ion transporter [Aureibacter tunicatorum]|uniref:Voltage-gated potassium channel n=1 Tax=Aureibacter tunicatorum TaxID=866807 RepID=A0AAE3XPJ6_9BACT|nr:ion transporter [Aureibacter tunicatorum]MDR6239684.1 voltage-gated potassium channel [Aureibacter tunicatorum]BDD04160.1 hypothetical protein AUTU_16430 [Aureibacter tunicatorum]